MENQTMFSNFKYFINHFSLFQRALSDSPNSVTYLASQINRIGRDVYEVLILMQLYGGQSVLQMLRQHHSQSELLTHLYTVGVLMIIILSMYTHVQYVYV